MRTIITMAIAAAALATGLITGAAYAAGEHDGRRATNPPIGITSSARPIPRMQPSQRILAGELTRES